MTERVFQLELDRESTDRGALTEILSGETDIVYTSNGRIYTSEDYERGEIDKIVAGEEVLEWEGPQLTDSVLLPQGVDQFMRYVKNTTERGRGLSTEEVEEREAVIDGVMEQTYGVVEDFYEDEGKGLQDYRSLLDELEDVPVDVRDQEVQDEYFELKSSLQEKIEDLQSLESGALEPKEVVNLFRLPMEEAVENSDRPETYENLVEAGLAEKFQLKYTPSNTLTAYSRIMGDNYLEEIREIIDEAPTEV